MFVLAVVAVAATKLAIQWAKIHHRVSRTNEPIVVRVCFFLGEEEIIWLRPRPAHRIRRIFKDGDRCCGQIVKMKKYQWGEGVCALHAVERPNGR